MTEIVLSSSSLTNNNHQSNTIIMSSQSSPDTSPQHPWPMVPVLQTLTVLSDGEEEQMEQKMGIENGLGNGGYSVGNNNNTVTGLSMTKMAIDNVVQHLHQQHNNNNNIKDNH
ncbi:hypothetical protein DERP_003856 [Dermatophagoides pteronyssinus]|uniref:Uncharacterized protein n=1 Tax=Dermatophagoides pteronyssinus TaxID=6956 RepID=A0ABQ8J7I7_DERPT|nr:hypothetical protein DERP_003856 [Dermatophagoides pteronyssinus]